MPKCVKCGHESPSSAEACIQCTWPFTRRAWPSSTHRIRRVTLDTSCINAKGSNPDLNILEQWGSVGYLKLQRSDAMLKELKGGARVEKAKLLETHPELFYLGGGLDGPAVLAGPDLPRELQEILFPTTKSLTENQQYDIEHLRLHVRTGGDVFVTLNPNDFITRGRQDALTSIGIWVLSPSELVGLLKDLYAWQ